jgi:hypothetical protein
MTIDYTALRSVIDHFNASGKQPLEFLSDSVANAKNHPYMEEIIAKIDFLQSVPLDALLQYEFGKEGYSSNEIPVFSTTENHTKRYLDIPSVLKARDLREVMKSVTTSAVQPRVELTADLLQKQDARADNRTLEDYLVKNITFNLYSTLWSEQNTVLASLRCNFNIVDGKERLQSVELDGKYGTITYVPK